jgi:competence protein ComEC
LHTSEHPPNNEFNVVALDVGQGMALLVETEHHRLLYDAGPLYSSQSDAGSSVITPYLKMRGITALDGVMISHGDTDHSGGAMTILEQLKIGWVSSSLEAENNVVRTAKNRSTHTPCVAGQTWEWDGVKFEVLYPNRNAYAKADSKPNAKSCVLKVSNQHYSLLLTGDIEAKQEHALIKTIPEKLPSTVLLAPHHGSGTSSSLEFLEAVNPRMAIFQVGYRNRYRHPKLTVWERYGELGIARLRTDDSGAILLRFGQEIETLEYRKASARYWFAL